MRAANLAGFATPLAPLHVALGGQAEAGAGAAARYGVGVEVIDGAVGVKVCQGRLLRMA